MARSLGLGNLGISGFCWAPWERDHESSEPLGLGFRVLFKDHEAVSH